MPVACCFVCLLKSLPISLVKQEEEEKQQDEMGKLGWPPAGRDDDRQWPVKSERAAGHNNNNNLQHTLLHFQHCTPLARSIIHARHWRPTDAPAPTLHAARLCLLGRSLRGAPLLRSTWPLVHPKEAPKQAPKEAPKRSSVSSWESNSAAPLGGPSQAAVARARVGARLPVGWLGASGLAAHAGPLLGRLGQLARRVASSHARGASRWSSGAPRGAPSEGGARGGGHRGTVGALQEEAAAPSQPHDHHVVHAQTGEPDESAVGHCPAQA